MDPRLSPSAQKVQDVLRSSGFPHQVVELPQTTRTSQEAAQAIGCRVEQIAKSLVFKSKQTQNPVLVIASGVNRVDVNKLARLVGEEVEKPDASYVQERTGFVIGGVAPIGHRENLQIFIDEDLLGLEEIWTAAGNPNAVFKLTPQDLVEMTAGQVVAVK